MFSHVYASSADDSPHAANSDKRALLPSGPLQKVRTSSKHERRQQPKNLVASSSVPILPTSTRPPPSRLVPTPTPVQIAPELRGHDYTTGQYGTLFADAAEGTSRPRPSPLGIAGTADMLETSSVEASETDAASSRASLLQPSAGLNLLDDFDGSDAVRRNGSPMPRVAHLVLSTVQGWAERADWDRRAGTPDGGLGQAMYSQFQQFDAKYMQPVFGAEGRASLSSSLPGSQRTSQDRFPRNPAVDPFISSNLSTKHQDPGNGQP